jgi:hypothetical protein
MRIGRVVGALVLGGAGIVGLWGCQSTERGGGGSAVRSDYGTPAESGGPTQSPPAPGFCKGGELVDVGHDDRGCSQPPRCVTADSCPRLVPPPPGFCSDGQLVGRVDQATGCPLPPACVTIDSCPRLVPPAPGFCKDGVVVASNPNERGCIGPPICVRAGTCPQL